MANRALTGVARAYGSIEGHLVSAADGAVDWSDLTEAQKDARIDRSDRQRTLWGLTQELERLEAALARTEGRVQNGSLTNDQAASIVDDVEADAALLRTEVAAIRTLDEVMFSGTTFTESPSRIEHWELLWRLRSLRGPLNWSIRRAAPGDAPMSVVGALGVLGEQGESMPAELRELLVAARPSGGVRTLNNQVSEAIADVRARRSQQENRRSA